MYKKMQTSNGLNVIGSNMPGMTSVSLGVWIGVGGRYELSDESGISHLIEHMLFKGTHARSTKKLKESIEGVGGSFNGFTSDEVTCYMVKVPAKYVKLGIDVLADMVIDPRLDETDLVKEKFVVSEEIKMYRDQPADHVVDLLAGIMWPGNALGRPLAGTITKVNKMKKNDLVAFRDEFYHPGNMSVIVAGKVNFESISKYACEKFKHLKKRRKKRFDSPKIKQVKPILKAQYRDINQTHVSMGFHAMAKNKKEAFAMKLMNVVLGGNMSSRLFENLREHNGLCYDISSSYKKHSDVGEMHIHAGVDTTNVFKSIDAILYELKVLKDSPVEKDELERAKNYIKGQFLLAIEATSSRMLWLGDRHMVHKRIPDVKNILKDIDSISSKDILNVSRKVLNSKSLNLAMIGKLKSKDKNLIYKEINRL